MWGAIIGDLAGSIYEYDQTKKITNVKISKLINNDSFFSDDTILTIAIIDSILNNKDYEFYLKKYTNDFINYKPNFDPYFDHPFSPNFMKWATENGKNNSIGNGALMRISPVGYMFETLDEIIDNTKIATKTSHNSKEAIENAILVNSIIFLARKNYPKEEILKKLNISLKYKPYEKFNYSCSETIDNCLYALFSSNNFYESLEKVISYGGDTDTNACIVGSMAEALYGIDNTLINEAKKRIPETFTKKIELAYKKIK